MKNFRFISALVALVMITVLFIGCGGQEESAPPEDTTAGNLIIRINPEISVDYNKEGLVTKIEGLNDDGRKVIADYDNYIGKDCKDVVRELVTEVHDYGYFVSDIEGEARNVTIQIEPGSVLPKENFLHEIAEDVQGTVEDLNLESKVLDIGSSDYDVRYQTKTSPSQYITKEKAAEIALAQAGVAKEEAVFDDREFDFDNGRPIYEFEFYSNGIEYEYDIDAITGKVLKSKVEHYDAVGATDYHGDSGYKDSDYGTSLTPPATPAPSAPARPNTSRQRNTDYDSGYTDYDSGYTDYDSGYTDYDSGYTDYDSGYTDYDSGYTDYDSGYTDYDSGYTDYDSGYTDYD